MTDLAAARSPAISSSSRPPGLRTTIMVAILIGATLLAALALHALRGTGVLNSYGALAEAFLAGHLDVQSCPEKDCAVFAGRTFVIFPPVPALVAIPFVAVFGAGFKGFAVLALALGALSLALWRPIFRASGAWPADAVLLGFALAFASPLFGVTQRGEAVWFFAQCVGFLAMSLALWAALARRDLLVAGLFLGCAFLCRQMTLLWAPALLALAVPAWGLNRETARGAARLSVGLGFAVLAYCVYNDLRFGSPLETGYRYIANADGDFMSRRLAEIGLFSPRYLVQNAVYLLLQGFRLDFAGPYLTEPHGLDPLGTSVLAASPWLILLATIRFDRTNVVLVGVAALICLITLFYHSNGYSQAGMQRYALDWLPLCVLGMARGPRPASFAALPVLVIWGMAMTLATFAAGALYGLAPPGV